MNHPPLHAVTMAQARATMRADYLAPERDITDRLLSAAGLSRRFREGVSTAAVELVREVRTRSGTNLIEKFLVEYGLSTDEGVALMCLAEALLRVPDHITIQALIDDKLGPGDWAGHLGQAKSPLINITTWGLLVAGKLIRPLADRNFVDTVRALTKRLGDPMVRKVAEQAMREMAQQFVLGPTVSTAIKRAQDYQAAGYTMSYDMLGEAAQTHGAAMSYLASYADAIARLTPQCRHTDIRDNPGVSVKLSALHPRFEMSQHRRIMAELVPRVLDLARQASAAPMGFNIDAEEAERLDLSLDVIEAVLRDPSLADWEGFGVVVQAYGKRAAALLDWLYALAGKLQRRIMVRLVKGAYWDTEIKRAQTLGLAGFPVFTRKPCSDVSFIACAARLLTMSDRIYPQFATHNAHSVCAVLALAEHRNSFEFQRLHGMGESLHEAVMAANRTRCRIYAPVGEHRDLLAYLVRRLLENGANSSFVNQIVDTRIAPEVIARDPCRQLTGPDGSVASTLIAPPNALYGAKRRNARGWDVTDVLQLEQIDRQRSHFRERVWQGRPVLAAGNSRGTALAVLNPARPDELVGKMVSATRQDVEQAIAAAVSGQATWSAMASELRAAALNRIADLYEQHAAELFALLCREAGKTLPDAIAELREAVDFARYYASRLPEESGSPLGTVTCISPWNFPLAIFSGQVLAALAAGNTVLAKPAEQTPLIAVRAVQLMHQAGIPRSALQLLPGEGAVIGRALTSDPRIDGVCFTGSTATATLVNREMASQLSADAPLVAETGGINAMIVDSTALPEQVVRDVIASAFRSAGQRCSALRMLYLQQDIADCILAMLFGAMDELCLGDPWDIATDIGPVIDDQALRQVAAHCDAFASRQRVLKRLPVPAPGRFAAPTVIQVDGIADLSMEVFGPVLHVATFAAAEFDRIIKDINRSGYGLTFCLHSRLDARVDQIARQIRVGNLYVNRNQTGAVVGSQPFGGEGLSGTGPKAGGPHYVRHFTRDDTPRIKPDENAPSVTTEQMQAAIDQVRDKPVMAPEQRLPRLRQHWPAVPAPLDAEPSTMPGPTGELNLLFHVARGVVICAGPSADSAMQQALLALSQGNRVVAVAPDSSSRIAPLAAAAMPIVAVEGMLTAAVLAGLSGMDAIVSEAETVRLASWRQALAARPGAILPLITAVTRPERYVLARHLCVDTTAAGGNASLVANSE